MKATTYAALLVGLVSTALAQTIAPSPTESVGCEPHGDHWHCEGPRETSTPGQVTTIPTDAATTTTTVAAATTTSAGHDDDGDHESHTDETHTDETGTGTLAPSPTESFGCEPHGDHWHCDGPVTTASTTAGGSFASTLVTTTSTTGAATTAAATTSAATSTTTTRVSTAGAPRYEAVGLGFAGLAAVAAMAF